MSPLRAMATGQTADRTAESFNGLLLRHRGRTGLTQLQLAARVGVSRGAVQDWESGLNYPDAQHLQALIAAFLEAGGLTVGSEAAEAEALWAAALRQSPRMRTPFDAVWWANALSARNASANTPPARPSALAKRNDEASRGASREEDKASRERHGDITNAVEEQTVIRERRQDWGEAPDVVGFVGRAQELATLRGWVLEERCRMAVVLGLGGIGKTVLAARLAQDVTPGFQRVYWRSLRNGLPIIEWLGGAIGFLSGQQLVPPEGEAARLTALLQLLRYRPSLLVLDNFETVLEPGRPEGRYRDGFAGYGSLLQAIGEGRHQSCLVVTSRESPPELAILGGRAVRALELGGLGVAEGQLLLADKQLWGNTEDWATLIGRFGGNGLALKVVGGSIRGLFGGDIRAFLGESGSGAVFGGIRRLLTEQIERGSALEQEVLRVLAVECEPVSIPDLVAGLRPQVRRGAVLEAVEALRRRSLVKRAETAGAAAFTLQSVVLEHLTEWVVEEVRDTITVGRPAKLVERPVIKSQAKDYVRQAQERLIGERVLQRLAAERCTGGAQAACTARRLARSPAE